MKAVARRKSVALKNVTQRRESMGSQEALMIKPVDLKQLVKIYLLDGSSKLLQMEENSSIEDVLLHLKFNLELESIATHALFLVRENKLERLPLNALLSQVLDPNILTSEGKLLFKSWIVDPFGSFERSVFQDNSTIKQPNTSVWLKTMEESYMSMLGKYIFTDEESIMLGCLKMQAESGNFNYELHTQNVLENRIVSRFPDPIKSKLKSLLFNQDTEISKYLIPDIITRVQILYSRLSGLCKIEAQIEFLKTLRTWCPFYGAAMYEVECQCDTNPTDLHSIPPVQRLTAAVCVKGIYLISSTNGRHTIMTHLHSKIVKYEVFPEHNFFIYWVLKKSTCADTFRNTDEIQGNIEDEFCDKIYLVSDQCEDIHFLVSTYRKMKDEKFRPMLPYASEKYLRQESFSLLSLESDSEEVFDHVDFATLSVEGGSTIQDDHPGLQNSVFKELYSTKEYSGNAETHNFTESYKLAGSMTDLVQQPAACISDMNLESSSAEVDPYDNDITGNGVYSESDIESIERGNESNTNDNDNDRNDDDNDTTNDISTVQDSDISRAEAVSSSKTRTRKLSTLFGWK